MAVKYLIVLLVVVAVLAWWMLRRRDGRGGPGRRARDGAVPGAVQPMLACAHCGVHLPGSEAVFDADQRAFCSDAHRLQGPR